MSRRRKCKCGHVWTARRDGTKASLGELLHRRPELADVVPTWLLAAMNAGRAS